METEDMIIVGLVVLIVICGALAFFVTSSGISFNNDPVPVMNNTTTNITTNNTVNNTSDDTSVRDTGASSPESSGTSSVSYSNQGYYSGSQSSYSDSSSSNIEPVEQPNESDTQAGQNEGTIDPEDFS